MVDDDKSEAGHCLGIVLVQIFSIFFIIFLVQGPTVIKANEDVSVCLLRFTWEFFQALHIGIFIIFLGLANCYNLNALQLIFMWFLYFTFNTIIFILDMAYGTCELKDSHETVYYIFSVVVFVLYIIYNCFALEHIIVNWKNYRQNYFRGSGYLDKLKDEKYDMLNDVFTEVHVVHLIFMYVGKENHIEYLKEKSCCFKLCSCFWWHLEGYSPGIFEDKIGVNFVDDNRDEETFRGENVFPLSDQDNTILESEEIIIQENLLITDMNGMNRRRRSRVRRIGESRRRNIIESDRASESDCNRSHFIASNSMVR